jgi:ribonuclease E
MGLIVRTAGAKRTKAEIKRDYEYLMRLWETSARRPAFGRPALVYEEEDLVKRAIRDLYDKDIDEASGSRARRLPRSARLHAHAHAEPGQEGEGLPRSRRRSSPSFGKVEDHLAARCDISPVVPLKSGGYLVINQTEALVAIDVNSGATRERNIEDTALKTNSRRPRKSPASCACATSPA